MATMIQQLLEEPKKVIYREIEIPKPGPEFRDRKRIR